MARTPPSVQRALAALLRDVPAVHRRWVIGRNSAPNWIGLPSQVIGNLVELNVGDLAGLVSDGIPVAWVPRATVLDKLISADREDRRKLLLSHESVILDDCIAVAHEIRNGALTEAAELLIEAASAARADYHSAAQALASNVLDTGLRITYPKRERWYRSMERFISDLQGNRELSNLRTGLALAPVLLAISEYDGHAAIPDFFNRHASAHGAGQLQYTRTNAIVAIMTASSALRECYEQGRPRGRPL